MSKKTCNLLAEKYEAATSGKTLITKIVEPGEVLGPSAAVSGKPSELTAETVDPCQINFVKPSRA